LLLAVKWRKLWLNNQLATALEERKYTGEQQEAANTTAASGIGIPDP